MKLQQRIPVSRSICAVASALLALTLVACERQSPTVMRPTVVPALPAEPPPQVSTVVAQKPAEPPQASADKELAGKVKTALLGEKGLNAHGIDVVAKNGVVTLYGTTETLGRRDTAARVAGNVDGVRSVDNKLAVVSGS